MLTQEERFRRFARAVTTELGALEDSFLGLGRSLGAARVLNAIGQGKNDITAIRRYLKLDSGLMSRLLRGLEAEGLIKISVDPNDSRRRLVALSVEGEREFHAYEALSDARATQILSRNRRMDELLVAIDFIATALIGDQIEIVQVNPESQAARACLSRYYEELNARFEGGFDVRRSRDPETLKMTEPNGAFFVAMSDNLPIGCGALCGDGSQVAEVKRVWVHPTARGFGFAMQLMRKIETKALELSIRELRLDTNRALTEAITFYHQAGWREIERFNDDPYADYFFSKIVGA